MTKNLIRIIIIIVIILSPIASYADGGDFVGEIRIFAGNSSTVPDGWWMTNGACKSQSVYPELYAVIGDYYDNGACGDGEFQLPSLTGRFPIGTVSNPGTTGGESEHTLTADEMPSHYHPIKAFGPVLAAGTDYYLPYQAGTQYGYNTENVGGSQPHNNMPPYLQLSFIIAYTATTTTTIAMVETQSYTQVYNVPIVYSTTSNISVTRVLSGDIEYIDGIIGFNPFFAFTSPLMMIAIFMIFLIVGVMIGKPTSFLIAYIALAMTGIFSTDNIYIQWSVFLLITAFMLYRLYLIRRKV